LNGAHARTDGRVLEGINGGSVPWAQVEITLNDDYDGGVLATLAEGETQTIGLTDCADRAGRCFTPQTLNPRTVALRATTGGRLYETRLTFKDTPGTHRRLLTTGAPYASRRRWIPVAILSLSS
jgi:hypothetical protein